MTGETDRRLVSPRPAPNDGPEPYGDRRAEPTPHEEAETVGRYAILSLLGEGGMGRVYAAFDDQLDRRVALKVLKAGPHEGARQRTLREAQAMARLSHPNVVTVFEAAEHEGELFVSMEHIKGDTLADWQRAGTRSWQEVLAAYLQAGRGLAAAHAEGLVHRDFKPHNAMVDGQGRVRVLDFGLVTRRGEVMGAKGESTLSPPPREDMLDVSLTETGTVMGTPAYMAPEQFMGGTIDHRSDQFSFCVALWEALYGQRPYLGSSRVELFAKIAQGWIDEPEASAVPKRLSAVLERGLRAAADERWPDMPSLLEALEPFAPAEDHAAGRPADPAWASLVAAVTWSGLWWASPLPTSPVTFMKALLTVIVLVSLTSPLATLMGFVVRKGASVDANGRPRRWWRRVLGSWATVPGLGFCGFVFALPMIFGAQRVWFLPFVVVDVAVMALGLAAVTVILERMLNRTWPWWCMSIVASLIGGVVLLPMAMLAHLLEVDPKLTLMAPVVGIMAVSVAVSLARPVE